MLFSLPALIIAVMILSWIAFTLVFITQKKPSSGPAKKREPASLVGIALQGVGYALVSIIHRPYFTPIAQMSKPLEIALASITVLLAIGSVWFVGSAVRALGKQWSFSARVVEGHELVTYGPYKIVRNPIYTGMVGMLLVMGLALAHWIGLIIGLIVFGMGTLIRVRSEEKLLRETFSNQWDDYARKVPAVVPFLI